MNASRWSVWHLVLAWIIGAMLLGTDVAAIRAYGGHAIAEEMRLSRAAAKARDIANADSASGFLMIVTQEEAVRITRPTRWLKVAGDLAGGGRDPGHRRVVLADGPLDMVPLARGTTRCACGLTIAEADKAPLLMLATLATIQRSLQLSSRR